MWETYPREYLPVNALAVSSAASMIYSRNLSKRQTEAITNAYAVTELAVRKYIRGDHLPNNWLKMHGRPKRRKDWEEL